MDATGCEQLTVLADRGYTTATRYWPARAPALCLHSQDTDICNASAASHRGGLIYDAEKDRYTCPGGNHLTKGKVRSDRHDNIDHYRNLTACSTCAMKPNCTPDKHKRLKRWEHEGVLDKMQARLDRLPDAMTIRRQTVEHPFGTLKAWMGSAHFLTRKLEKVRTEMSLHVLAYNMKRLIQNLRRQTADANHAASTSPPARVRATQQQGGGVKTGKSQSEQMLSASPKSGPTICALMNTRQRPASFAAAARRTRRASRAPYAHDG